jgi:epsilon-lactone hydrolase
MSMQQLEAILQASSAAPPPDAPDPIAWRDWFEAINAQTPQAPGLDVETINLGVWSAERLSANNSVAGRLIIYYHGGGFLFGSSQSHRTITSHLAVAAKSEVLSVDYRLAPEYPAPAAHDDCFAAYRWALEQGYAPEQIALAGDSAGGNLALSTALRARDQGLALPACVAMMSPALDLAGEGASQNVIDQPPLLNRQLTEFFIQAYVQDGNLRSESVTPFYSDLTGLPPTLIHVGDWELLTDDSITIASRLQNAGVAAEVKVWPGMVHCWQLFAPMLAEGMQSVYEIAEFIGTHTANSSAS